MTRRPCARASASTRSSWRGPPSSHASGATRHSDVGARPRRRGGVAFAERPDAPDGEPVGARGGDGVGGAGALVGAVHDVEVGADEGERLVADDEAAAVDAHERTVGDGAHQRKEERRAAARRASLAVAGKCAHRAIT